MGCARARLAAIGFQAIEVQSARAVALTECALCAHYAVPTSWVLVVHALGNLHWHPAGHAHRVRLVMWA